MDFYKRAAYVCGMIPYGKVATYGQIALLCGKPRNARQVGYALNRKLEGREICAHRVVNASGVLSGAAAFSVPDMQKCLLEAEGVEVEEGRRVDLKKYGWNHSLKEAEHYRDKFRELGI